MSFSKAKLVRFNEVLSLSSKLHAKEKSTEKFKKALSSAGTESPTASDNGSIKSVPGNFKTPTLPKKTKTATSTTKSTSLFKNDLEALKDKSEECEQKTKYIHKLTEELSDCEKQLDELKREKEQLQREHQNELENLEFEMLQTMTKLQKAEEELAFKTRELEERLEREINSLKKSHEYQKGQLVLDYEIRIKELNEASEEVLKAKIEEIENKFKGMALTRENELNAILKECQAISEYNIIQCELEKKNIQMNLEELRQSYTNLVIKYEELASGKDQLLDPSCDRLELTNKIKDLTKLIEQKEAEILKLSSEVKAYQITINTSQVTIEVLKRRLIDSDRDVEQLKLELSKCDEKLLEYENKHIQLKNELQAAKESHDDLELQYESSIKLNETAINIVKDDLITRVSGLERQVKHYSKVIAEKEELKNEILQQLEDNIEAVKQMSLEIEEIEEFYGIQVKELEETVEKYGFKKDDLSKQVESLTKEKEDLKDALYQKNKTIEDLEAKLREVDATNDVLKEKCSNYLFKLDELEVQAADSAQIRKKYIDISGKYDTLLQDYENIQSENRDNKRGLIDLNKKMERLLDIEEKYEQMKKEKEILEAENMSYKFEEMKLKKYKFASKDKENIGSPNRSVIESPNRGSPFRGSPFRERN